MSQDKVEELKQPADDTANQNAPTDETNGSQTQENPVEKTSEIDYKALLEKERSQRERAEKKIVKLKNRERETVDEDAIAALREEISNLRGEITQTLSRKELDDAIKSVTTNQDEAELIKHHLENSIKSSGDIQEDVKRAKALANATKLDSENAALKEAVKTKADNAPDYGSRRIQPEKPSNLSPKDQEFLNKFRSANNITK